MKKVICLFVLSLCSFVLMAQQDTLNDKRILTSVGMGASFGSGFWGGSFASTYLSTSVNNRLNDKLSIRAGVAMGDTWLNSPQRHNSNTESKAPYENKYRNNAAFIGVDYVVNPRMMLSFSAFYDGTNPLRGNNHFGRDMYTYGFDASFAYQIGDNSFLNLRLTFVESNNPFYNPLDIYYSPIMQNHYNPFGRGFYSGFNW